MFSNRKKEKTVILPDNNKDNTSSSLSEYIMHDGHLLKLVLTTISESRIYRLALKNRKRVYFVLIPVTLLISIILSKLLNPMLANTLFVYFLFLPFILALIVLLDTYANNENSLYTAIVTGLFSVITVVVSPLAMLIDRIINGKWLASYHLLEQLSEQDWNGSFFQWIFTSSWHSRINVCLSFLESVPLTFTLFFFFLCCFLNFDRIFEKQWIYQKDLQQESKLYHAAKSRSKNWLHLIEHSWGNLIINNSAHMNNLLKNWSDDEYKSYKLNEEKLEDALVRGFSLIDCLYGIPDYQEPIDFLQIVKDIFPNCESVDVSDSVFCCINGELKTIRKLLEELHNIYPKNNFGITSYFSLKHTDNISISDIIKDIRLYLKYHEFTEGLDSFKLTLLGEVCNKSITPDQLEFVKQFMTEDTYSRHISEIPFELLICSSLAEWLNGNVEYTLTQGYFDIEKHKWTEDDSHHTDLRKCLKIELTLPALNITKQQFKNFYEFGDLL